MNEGLITANSDGFWYVFGRIGVMSFGGPAAQIALMHRELVEERPWMSEAEFLRALSFCMLLPGPEAMQLATYAGWLRRGIPGGLIAGGLFVLPGAMVILMLAAIYSAFGQVPLVSALFLGVKAAVIAIVIEAVMRVSRRALTDGFARGVAVAAFVALFFFNVPFPAIIATAAIAGAARFAGKAAAAEPMPETKRHGTAGILLIGLASWWGPVFVLWVSGQDFLVSVAVLFSKLAVVTFGGAYSVLAYLAQAAVQDYHWLGTSEMMDALGLAETTPGPLILVTEFVAYLAGHSEGGTVLAVAAAIVTLWVTFVPCFLWVFAFAPFIEGIARRPRLGAAMSGISAAVVGAISSLALWFALHLLFARVETLSFGPIGVEVPDLATLNHAALLIAALCAVMLLRLHWTIPVVLGLAAGLGGLLAFL
jgi:chromate transporter